MASTNKVLPSVFAEATYQLDGRPFRLTDRHYLKQIYDSDITDGMIMSGRQVEKSTTNSTNMANHTLLQPNFKGLYFAPLNSQVKEFSKERIGKLYQYSQEEVVKKNYITKEDTQNVSFKTFSGNNANATNYFKHCYGLGDNIRGITVNGIWGDEIQDIHIDAIPVIKECQAHALDAGARCKVTWWTGTPKTFSNTIQQYWDKSSQAEWVVMCPHCRKFQIMDLPNLTPTKFICVKCKMDLPKEAIINGMWYELQKNKEFKGFRISQLMVPWITAADIWNKFSNYSTAKFYNEVLGRSYENASKPFNPVVLNKLFNNNFSLLNRAEGKFANAPIYMGVDWGTGEKSFTIAEVYALTPEGKMQLIHAKIFNIGNETESDFQVDYISNLMQIFKVRKCVVDWGFGWTQYQTLQKRFGVNRVTACYYSFNLGVEKKYDEAKGRWICNRTKIMSNYIDAVRGGEFIWPGSNKGELDWLIDQHLVENAEYRKSLSGKSEDLMYTHPDGQPDDALHSGVYAKLARDLDVNVLEGITFASAYGSNI